MLTTAERMARQDAPTRRPTPASELAELRCMAEQIGHASLLEMVAQLQADEPKAHLCTMDGAEMLQLDTSVPHEAMALRVALELADKHGSLAHGLVLETWGEDGRHALVWRVIHREGGWDVDLVGEVER